MTELKPTTAEERGKREEACGWPKDFTSRLIAQVERLEKQKEMDDEFYKLTVLERDAERLKVDRLEAEVKRLQKAVLHFGQACWNEPVDLEGLLEELDACD